MITIYVLSSALAVFFASISCPIPAILSMLVFLGILGFKVHQQHIAPRYHTRRVL